MDRRIIYPAQIPLVEDQLQAARFAGIGIGRIAGALYGEGGIGASGFECTPGSGLVVIVAPGEIIAPGVVDTSTFGVLPASSSALPRQFIMADPASITIPGTGETFTIYGTPATNDSGNTVLPYFNSANPSQTYAGSANSGTGQATVRSDSVTIGIGTSPPSGSIPLWSVSVPSGATTIASSMIFPAHGAPLYPSLVELASLVVAPHNPNLAAAFGGYPQKSIVADPSLTGTFWVSTIDNNLSTPGEAGASWTNLFAPVQAGRLLNVQVISSSQAYVPTPGTSYVIGDMVGGGGGGGGSPGVNDNMKCAPATGGQAGSWLRFRISAAQIAGLYITIGSAGQGGGASGANGTAGGDTSFGAFYRAYGGPGGTAGAAVTAPASGLSLSSVQSAPSGNTVLAGLGGGPTSWSAQSGQSGVASRGGDSHFGPGGFMGPGQSGATYGAAGGPGGGGAGAFVPGNYTSGLPGAPGGAGYVVLYEYS